MIPIFLHSINWIQLMASKVQFIETTVIERQFIFTKWNHSNVPFFRYLIRLHRFNRMPYACKAILSNQFQLLAFFLQHPFCCGWCVCFSFHLTIHQIWDYIQFYFNLIVMWYLAVTSISNIARQSASATINSFIAINGNCEHTINANTSMCPFLFMKTNYFIVSFRFTWYI